MEVRGQCQSQLLCCDLQGTPPGPPGDPAYYSLQTICFFVLLHSSTCRSWRKKGYFQLFSRLFSTLHKMMELPMLVERRKVGTQRTTSGTITAAVLTPVSERLVAASHLWTRFFSDPECSSLKTPTTPHPKDYSIVIAVHLILKLPSAKMNFP